MSNNIELNREQLLDELSNFEKKKTNCDIPEILDKYLQSVAENGDIIFPWNKLQPLLRRKLELVMTDFNEKCPTDHLIQLPNVKQFDFEELKSHILEAIDAFPSAPFTIQRLCELITNPLKHYKRTDKFMRGIEKNILVVTTIEPKSALTIGDGTHYSTSSFKNLFSSLHSSLSSLQSSSSTGASTSLLVNGIADVMCENQMSIHSTNEDMITDPKPNLNACPVSPTSLPLSPTTSSPPSQHLPPLQQLDSFTTVFASSPSTPLSVVSDLHAYEQSSSLSLMSSTPCPKSPKESLSFTATTDIKDTQNGPNFESSTPNSLIDSSVISSSNSVSQVNTSPKIDSSEIEEKEDKSLHDFNESKPSDISQTETDTKINEDLNESSNDDNYDNKNNNINNTDNTGITSSSPEQNDNNNEITNENEESKNNSKESNEEIKPLIEDFCVTTQSQDEMIESTNSPIVSRGHELHVRGDEDMSTPMDYCGSNNNSLNNSDFIHKTSQLTPDCNIMDDTLSQSEQSDQSEPMDED